MADGTSLPQSTTAEPPLTTVADSDTAMTDAPSAATPTTSTPTHARVSTPTGGRTSTPQRNGGQPAAPFSTQPVAPTKANPNGAKCRQYLNEKVTTVLLEGMKRVAAEQPETPLKTLGEFLLAKSKELEGTS